MTKKLKKLNPDIEFFSVKDKEFKSFGRIISNIDADEIIKEAEKINMPEENSIYLTSVEQFENLEITTKIKNLCYGSLNMQTGYCYGHNSYMNATEWHSSSEINIAVTDLVLILGHIWDIENKKIDSSAFKAFFVPKGTVIEVYATTLHFCPCEVNKNGFGCVVCLPVGTNTELEVEVDDKILFRKNKWIIAHVENEGLINRGVVAGIEGINYKINY